jgi:hypothetical protein
MQRFFRVGGALVLPSALGLMLLVMGDISARAQQTQPSVAIHDSELTRALEGMNAVAPTPTGSGTTGKQWWPTDWHYFVMPESVKEAFKSDGTAFTVVGDSNVTAGALLNNGQPRYPIVISLASEAVRDDEIAQFTNYVASGGFLFIGSSAFTRNTNGTSRSDFAFANQLGLHLRFAALTNWTANSTFTKTNQPTHRLVNEIPAGQLTWRMPSYSDEIPWGISPSHPYLAPHDVWQVTSAGATVLAQGDTSPFLAVRQYGKGYFIYCSAFQPLIGHSGFAPSMYAYLILRRSIEWAFESANMPIPKLSPWPFQYDAAYMVRHDLENFTNEIAAIEASAQVEFTNGAKGDYFFCTGALRDDASPTYNTNSIVAGMRRATTNYGATIGPHNGGLKNPNNSALVRGQYDYWHWGPDEALDVTPPGYSSGKAYAMASISNSFRDVESWLSGITNGPRSWVGCYFNATREDSYDLQAQLGVKIAGDQKLTPFPHWTVSTLTPNKRYTMLSEPVSDWFVGGLVAQSLEPWHPPGVQTSQTMHDGIDFYYKLGALVNFYSHTLSTGLGDAGSLVPDYVSYCSDTNQHPRMWPANAALIYQWWLQRSNAQVSVTFATNGAQSMITFNITGSANTNTAVEMYIPGTNQICNVQVLTNGTLAGTNIYRINGQTFKLRVGSSVTNASISYYPLGPATQVFAQNFDSVTAPALPSGWTTSFSGAESAWVTETSVRDTSPNGAFVPDPGNVGLSDLVSPPISLPAGSVQLSFQNNYDFETGPGTDGYDGGVLDIKIGTGAFTDIITAGGSFVSGGYNSTIDSGYQNPIAGRQAWSGTSGAFIPTIVTLPAAASGQIIQLRWRAGTDNGNGLTGWRIDTISISSRSCSCCSGTTTNTAPVLPVQINRTIPELTTLVVTNTATDTDSPPNILSYSLTAAPANATISVSGIITWTPSESQGPSTNLFTTVVTDNGIPPLSASNTFTVTVTEVNSAPVLPGQPDQAVNALSTLVVTNTASDSDVPANSLIYTLVNPPAGASIDSNGLITWTPTLAQSPSTNLFTTIVSDNGSPPLSATNSFKVMVLPLNVLFTDDFSRGTDPGPLAPWIAQSGNWLVSGGMLSVTNAQYTYGFVYQTNIWTNFSAQARIRFSSVNGDGGGISARFNPVTGAHYVAWLFPDNSIDGGNTLRLLKFQEWNAFEYLNVAGQAVAQVNVPSVGTNWHTVKISCQGSQIAVSYDGAQVMTATDVESNPYLAGSVGIDQFTDTNNYTMYVDDVLVSALPPALTSLNDLYVVNQGATLNVPAPGVLGNDTSGSSNALTATRVSGPTRGTLTFNENGGFTYVPSNGVVGMDSFTYTANNGFSNSLPTTVSIDVTPSTNSFYDDFARSTNGSPFAPWVVGVGEWTITNGTLLGTATIPNDYSDAYIPANFTDFSIQAQIKLPNPSWACGLSGRVDPTTGARYVANVYPESSPLAPTPALRLIKFHNWTTWSSTFTPMALVSLPSVGTSTHTLKMTFQGNVIDVYYDGTRVVHMADTNVDGLAPYMSGAAGAHMYMGDPFTATFDNLTITPIAGTNTPPVLPTQTSRTIAALTTLTVTNTASDSDVPAQGLNYQLISPPTGAAISANGVITWTPGTNQAPSTNLITTVVTDTGTPPLSATNSFSVIVTPLNAAPTLPAQSNRTIPELTTLTVTNTASDDGPASGLSYALLAAPAGASISSSGVITWTPTEAQGPSTNVFTTRVTDSGNPPLSATNSFSVVVTEVNSAPTLPPQSNRTIPELTTLTVMNTAADSDIPANTLTYSLIAPPGAVISSSGVITWTPTEAQGPSTNLFTTIVTDNGSPALSATNAFTVVVTEVNTAPVLPAQTNRSVIEATTLVVTNTATDSDIPANHLAYVLINPPSGAAIDTNGIITWTPTPAQGPGTNVITTVVTDDGSPPLSATNSFTVFVIDTNTPPVITSQPVNATNSAGTTATFTVGAGGSALSYQWQKGTSPLANATTSSLSLPSVSDSDAGGYSVIVSNPYGSVTSVVATLTVIDPPSIVTQPASLTNNAGTLATFAVTATGTNPGYQWRKNGANLANGGNVSGATSSFLALSSVSSADAASYTVVITNSAGSITSSIATLTVISAPVITSQPQSRTNAAGTTATFTVVASGTTPIYQWIKNATNSLIDAGNITGSASATLTISNVSDADIGNYTVVLTNAAGSVTSALAVLTVIDPPVIVTQPASQTNNTGTTATFAVSVTGTSPTFQWRKNGTNNLVNGGNVSGATSSSLSLANLALTDAGTYAVVITNLAGSVTSSPATLTIISTNPPGQLFADDFTRGTDPGPISPWIAQSGTWTVTGGALRTGTNTLSSYGYAYITNTFTNFTLQGQVRFQMNNAYGGGLGACLNRANGAHYGAWLYPEGSPAGSNLLRLVKFQTWTTWAYQGASYTPMAQVRVGSVGTNWHTLSLTCSNNQIRVSYDGTQMINTNDAEASPYLSGGISADLWTDTRGYLMYFDNVTVTSLNGLQGQTLMQPLVTAEPPQIQSIVVTNGYATVTWTASPESNYRLQYKNDLNAPEWSDVQPDIIADGPTASATDKVGAVSQRYYRVVRLQ